MAFGTKKFDFFLDGTRGIMGTFVKIVPVPEEEGLVDVYYIPLSSWIPKAHVLKSIPRAAIVRFQMPVTSPGVQGTYTIVTEDSKGQADFFNSITNMKMESINSFREKLSDEQFKSRTATYKAKEASESLDRQKQKQRERERQSRPSFGFNRPGFPDGVPPAAQRDNNVFLEDL